MTNCYLSWNSLKAMVNGGHLKYHLQDWNWQLYILSGADAFIHYIPRPDKFDQMVIDDATKAQAQTDYDDFNNNYKATAIETEGVKD